MADKYGVSNCSCGTPLTASGTAHATYCEWYIKPLFIKGKKLSKDEQPKEKTYGPLVTKANVFRWAKYLGSIGD